MSSDQVAESRTWVVLEVPSSWPPSCQDGDSDHPQFVGKTATFSEGAPYDANLYVYPDGLNTEFLTELGFTITPGLKKHQQTAGEQAITSAELVDAIDADVIVFATESQQNFEELQKWSTLKNLDAVRE